MKNYLILLTVLLFSGSFAQQKTNFLPLENELKKIKPEGKFDGWALYKLEYGRNKKIFSTGVEPAMLIVDSTLFSDANSGYYIVYQQGAKAASISTVPQLQRFVGKPDTPFEYYISVMDRNYFVDYEYYAVAGNFFEDSQYLYLDLGKVTSEECPFAKSFFTLKFDKKTGKLLEEVEGKRYMEIYHKNCQNNPHLKYMDEVRRRKAAEAEKKPRSSQYE